jgi:hypothetical protein
VTWYRTSRSIRCRCRLAPITSPLLRRSRPLSCADHVPSPAPITSPLLRRSRPLSCVDQMRTARPALHRTRPCTPHCTAVSAAPRLTHPSHRHVAGHVAVSAAPQLTHPSHRHVAGHVAVSAAPQRPHRCETRALRRRRDFLAADPSHGGRHGSESPRHR